ncbi:MAG: glycine cleavage system protein GcvH [Desulfobacterales bacterium]
MKEIHELEIPENLRFAKDHEWARQENDLIRVGISDYAQSQMGDVVYVELPQVGENFSRDEPFGSIESVKAVSELYMPLGGEVVEINSALEKSPELVNQSPYEQGWLIMVKPADDLEMDSLMNKDAYLDMLKGLEA